MATKFYLLNEAAPYTPAAWQGGWDLDGTVSRAMDPHKFGGVVASATRAETDASNPYRVGVLRLVSRRLAPQTISGTVDGVFGVAETNAGANFFTRLHLYVINSTSGAVHGTLLNQYEETSAGGASEWTTTNTGRGLQSAQTLSDVTIPNDGDDYRIVAEIGVRAENADTTSFTASVRYGARPSTVGPAHGDLTVGSTSTTLAGFLEFSGTVALASDVVPHLTPEDAFIIGPTLPFSDSFTADDAGYTYTMWGTFAGQSGVTVLSVFGFGDLTTYTPRTGVYDALSDNVNTPTIAVDNRPVQFATVLGTDYYVRFSPNTGNPTPATLAVTAQAAPNNSLAGGIIVPDDSLPIAAILSASQDYTVLGFRPFPAGEAGDVLVASGAMAMENVNDGTVDIYDSAFALVTQLAINSQTLVGSIRANNTLNKFFILSKTPDPDQVVAVLPAGTIDATYTITGVNNIRAIAVSNDESILYYSISSGDTLAVKRWDLDAGSALSDLVNLGGTGTTGIADIIVLSDGTVLVNFYNFSTGATVRHYAADGTLLHTYDYADSDERFPDGTPPRIARANDDPASFWLWRHPISETGVSVFRNIQISDGTVLTTRRSAEYEIGSYVADPTATPLGLFGNSYSCPFFVLPEGCPTAQTNTPFNLSPAGATFYGELTGVYIEPQDTCTQVAFEWAETVDDTPVSTGFIQLDPDSWPNPAFTLQWPRPRRANTYVYRAVVRHCPAAASSCPTAYGDWVEFTLPDMPDGVIGPLVWVRWPREVPE